ncbi:MAG: hypothetical protein LQ340_007429, partial [Diploschistes diacapsis]
MAPKLDLPKLCSNCAPLCHGVLPYILLSTIYLLLIRLLRYRRAHHHQQIHYQPSTPQSTILRAQSIYRSLFQLEFPFLATKGIQLALFRTYAIPTISSLLDRTKLLSSPITVAHRYSETWALFNEFALREWGSPHWVQAMARTRAIHAAYRKSGKVREEDMLYTLAAVATQPVVLINRWEWREITDEEICAIGTLYRGIGDALDIDYMSFFRSTPG